MKRVQAMIQEACREKTERDRRRGIKKPSGARHGSGNSHVGKSTFINTFAGKPVQRRATSQELQEVSSGSA